MAVSIYAIYHVNFAVEEWVGLCVHYTCYQGCEKAGLKHDTPQNVARKTKGPVQ